MKSKSFAILLVNLQTFISYVKSDNELLRMLAPTCSWTCANNCAKCDGIQFLPDGTKKITINFASCKNDKISWACCAATPGCVLNTCDGTPEGTNKCNELTTATYTVPGETTVFNVQVHDGQLAGNVDCSAANSCCGGSGTSCSGVTSGVCNYQVDLSTCPCTECTTDTDCGTPDPSTCSKPTCGLDNKCSIAALTSGTVCKVSSNVCENNAVCDGVNKACPATTFSSSTTVCRAAVSACDKEDYCTGTNNQCGPDLYQPSGTVCEGLHGLCGTTKKCTGLSTVCA